MNKLLKYLKKHGERFDMDIAEGTGMSIAIVRQYLAELAAKHEVVTYHTTRFVEGNKVVGVTCRLAAYTPPSSTGRKSKAQLNLS